MKKTRITITIREDILKELKEKSNIANRNISNYIETLIIKDMKK